MPKKTSKPQPPATTKRVAPPFDRSLGTPKARQAQHRLVCLKLLARFKYVRSLDVAAALAPQSSFKGALSTANRTLKRLLADKLVTRYLSDSRRTYYALGAKGARLLRDMATEGGDGTAQASSSRASEKTNPEHALWSVFAVVTSEARGLTALTEREFQARFLKPNTKNPRRPHKSFPLYYTTDSESRKGLMPDAVAFSEHDDGLTWYEVDRSNRGSGRLADLVGLVRQMGSEVDMGDGSKRVLRRVVLLCKTRTSLGDDRTHLTGKHGGAWRIRLGNNAPALTAVDDQRMCFEVRKDIETVVDHIEQPVDPNQSTLKPRTQLMAEVVGQVHLQLLPTHLPSYSYADGPATGWYDGGGLPYIDPTACWPEPSPTT